MPRTAKDVQPVGGIGPGGRVAVPCGGQGAARSDLLPGVALRERANLGDHSLDGELDGRLSLAENQWLGGRS